LKKGFQYPTEYGKAFLDNTYQAWYPGTSVYSNPDDNSTYYFNMEMRAGGERDSKAPKLLKFYKKIASEYYYQKIGTRFLFLADEFYSIAGLSVPDNDSYESYPQIENGIGMIRQLAEECADYWPRLLAEQKSAIDSKPSSHILIPTGVSALPYIKELVEKYARAQDHVEVFAVPNRFFGPSVTVTGLITGKDLLSALEGKTADRVMISRSMLRENDDTLLDDLSVGDLQMKTGLSFRVVMNQGSDFLNALYGA